MVFDFSEIWLPFNATISTFIAGNDFRYDANDENPKKNFTTYFELGYKIEEIFKTFTFSPTLGVILNNEAKAYVYADYDKPSLANISLLFSKEFALNDKLTLPISLSYIHNASTKNTEVIGRNFIVAVLSLAY